MSALRLSHPGQPVRLVPDADPYLGLSQRNRQILDTVRAHAGNRSRAARELGITTPAVQHVMRLCERAGARVPASVTGRRLGVPNREPRPLGPRCPQPVSDGLCGRGAGHPGKCVSVVAWQRRRPVAA